MGGEKTNDALAEYHFKRTDAAVVARVVAALRPA